MPIVYPSTARRMWNLRPWRRSTLMRVTDRIQSSLKLALAVLLIATVPVAALFGLMVHGAVLRAAATGQAGVRVVSATLDADTARPSYRANAMAIPAHWTVAGQRHTGLLEVAGSAPRGTRIALRVDAAGNPAAQPLTRADATPDAVFEAVLALAMADAALLALWWLAKVWLDRHRRAQWAREWALVDLAPRRA
jgi:hypothetical protein